MSVSFRGTENYVASPELMGAVDIAVALQKPLLIKGEPGTGKTMLAQAVADALGKKLIIWNVKSTTKAQDGLYVYDVVQRLYDSQFGSAGVDDIAKYIKLGKLGEAFSTDEQVVLLIDEPLHPRRPRFPFRVSLVNPRSLELLDAQLCAFGVMLSPCGTMRATMKGVPNGEDVQIARGLP